MAEASPGHEPIFRLVPIFLRHPRGFWVSCWSPTGPADTQQDRRCRGRPQCGQALPVPFSPLEVPGCVAPVGLETGSAVNAAPRIAALAAENRARVAIRILQSISPRIWQRVRFHFPLRGCAAVLAEVSPRAKDHKTFVDATFGRIVSWTGCPRCALPLFGVKGELNRAGRGP